nr:hypothetical protein [Mariniblastus fucicola]
MYLSRISSPTQKKMHVVQPSTTHAIHPAVDTSDFQIGGWRVWQYGQEKALLTVPW